MVSYQVRNVSLTLLGARWDIQGISTILNSFLDEVLSHVLQREGLVDTSGLVSCLGLLHPVVVDIPGQVGVDAGTAAAIVVSGKALVLSEEGARFNLIAYRAFALGNADPRISSITTNVVFIPGTGIDSGSRS
jgi:hypothetical protein